MDLEKEKGRLRLQALVAKADIFVQGYRPGGLERLGFSVWDSSANFVLARIGNPPADWLYQELKKRHILVRYFNQDRLRDCLRISVGTDQEIETFLRELENLLAS